MMIDDRSLNIVIAVLVLLFLVVFVVVGIPLIIHDYDIITNFWATVWR